MTLVMASVQPRNDISLLESRTDEGICSGIFTVVLTLFSLILVICTFPFSLCVCVRMVQVYTLVSFTVTAGPPECQTFW